MLAMFYSPVHSIFRRGKWVGPTHHVPIIYDLFCMYFLQIGILPEVS